MTGSAPGSDPTAEAQLVERTPGRSGATPPLLAVEGLHVAGTGGDILRGVDLAVARGEALGVVGESGSGKTTLGLAILGLLDRSRSISAGEIRLEGDLIGAASVDATAGLRGSRLTFVPQDPFRSFDPLRRMGPQVRRPLELHRGLDAVTAERRVAELVGRLGVAEPDAVLRRYPHELSGGMLQRAAIATALSCEPELVVADEPTTALDALVQVDVIASFMALVRDLGTSLLVITHDLSLLEKTSDRVAAMYAGRIVEFDRTSAMLATPRHPYPAALLESALVDAQPDERLKTVDGQPPSLPGTFLPCAFAPRCPRADDVCRSQEPRYEWPATRGVACHHPLGSDA